MYNLMSAEFFKLRKSTYFKIITLISLGFAIFLFGLFYYQNINKNSEFITEFVVMTAIQVPLLLYGIFGGLFIGKDFSDKTINNEIMSGNSRINILISKSILFLFSSVIISLAYIVPILILIRLGYKISVDINTFNFCLLLNFVMSSICIIISFIFKDTGKTIGICLVGLLLFISVFQAQIFRLLGQNLSILTFISISFVVIIIVLTYFSFRKSELK